MSVSEVIGNVKGVESTGPNRPTKYVLPSNVRQCTNIKGASGGGNSVYYTVKIEDGRILSVPRFSQALEKSGRSMVCDETGSMVPEGDVYALNDHLDEYPEIKERIGKEGKGVYIYYGRYYGCRQFVNEKLPNRVFSSLSELNRALPKDIPRSPEKMCKNGDDCRGIDGGCFYNHNKKPLCKNDSSCKNLRCGDNHSQGRVKFVLEKRIEHLKKGEVAHDDDEFGHLNYLADFVDDDEDVCVVVPSDSGVSKKLSSNDSKVLQLEKLEKQLESLKRPSKPSYESSYPVLNSGKVAKKSNWDDAVAKRKSEEDEKRKNEEDKKFLEENLREYQEKLEESEEFIARCTDLVQKQSQRITELEDEVQSLKGLLNKAQSNVYQTPPKTIRGPPGAPEKGKLVSIVSPEKNEIKTDEKDSKSEAVVTKKSYVRSVYIEEESTPVVEEDSKISDGFIEVPVKGASNQSEKESSGTGSYKNPFESLVESVLEDDDSDSSPKSDVSVRKESTKVSDDSAQEGSKSKKGKKQKTKKVVLSGYL